MNRSQGIRPHFFCAFAAVRLLLRRARTCWAAVVSRGQRMGENVTAAWRAGDWRHRWVRWRRLGASGERAAARYLKRQGYVLLARGYRSEQGEIDLIFADGETIVFVEVKTRRCPRHGTPAEAVNPAQQRRIGLVALSFLKRHDLLEYSHRYDIVSIIWPAGQRRPEIAHHRWAFVPRLPPNFFA